MEGGKEGGRQQNWKLFNDVIIAEGKCVYTQWPATRPLVSVTGLAGFLFFLSPTEKPAGYELCGDRIVQKTGRVNDAHGIFLPSDGGRIRGGPLSSISDLLRPSYTQIIQQLLLIMPLSRNYVLAPLLSSAAERDREQELAALLSSTLLPCPAAISSSLI